jgi:Glycosyl transferases group 1
MFATTKAARHIIKRAVLASQPAAADTVWHVSEDELKDVRIRWPVTLEWGPAWTWVEPLFYGFRARVPVEHTDIPQLLKGTVVIELARAGRVYRVGLNFGDYPDEVHFGRTADVGAGLDLEFKSQYRAGGYSSGQIVPGGYVSDQVLVDWHARRPRRLRARKQFSWDVYGRFGLQFATEVRSKAITALTGQRRFKFFGGDRKVAFPEFLAEVARSRVCIDLPGNGPFCFRLVNYFAVGACVISPPHGVKMPIPLVDRTHIVYTRPDMSDLIDLCEQYTHDDAAREAIARASREYYSRHLYWRSLATYYLRTMLDKLPT